MIKSLCTLVTIQTAKKVVIFSGIALYYGDNYILLMIIAASYSKHTWTCCKIESSYDKIITTIVLSYNAKYLSLIAFGIITHAVQQYRIYT